MRTTARGILLLFPALLVFPSRAARCGQDPVRRGLELLRKGKAKQALDLLEKEVKRVRARKEGKEPPPELFYDLGLAALRAGKAARARAAFLEALAGAGKKKDELRALAGWGLGSALWRLGQAAEKAGPAGLDKALEFYREARDAWVRALLARPSWKALARNIERANRKIQELKKKKQQQKKQQQQQKKQQQNQKQNQKKNDQNKKNQKNRKDQKKNQKQNQKNQQKQQKQQKQKNQQNQQKQQNRRNQRKDQKKSEPKEKKQNQPKSGEKKKQEQQDRRSSGKPRREKSRGGKEKKEKPLMSPEQWKKLVDKLKRLEAERIRLEKGRVPARPRGGRGW